MRCLLIDQAITGEHSPGSAALERLLGLLGPGPETAQGDGLRPSGDVSNIRSMQSRDNGAMALAGDEITASMTKADAMKP
jgi:hypothetical protein